MKHWILGSVAAIGLASALVCGAAEEKKPAGTTGTATPAAQRPARPGGGPGQQADRLKMLAERLGLSAEQQEKLKPLLAEETKKMQELRQDTNLQGQERRDKMAKIREDSRKKIKDAKILTDDQWKKWDEMLAKQRQRGQGQGQGGQGRNRGQGQGQGGGQTQPK